jgi:hypothetical protein
MGDHIEHVIEYIKIYTLMYLEVTTTVQILAEGRAFPVSTLSKIASAFWRHENAFSTIGIADNNDNAFDALNKTTRELNSADSWLLMPRQTVA